jgi:hypothetical protein
MIEAVKLTELIVWNLIFIGMNYLIAGEDHEKTGNIVTEACWMIVSTMWIIHLTESLR